MQCDRQKGLLVQFSDAEFKVAVNNALKDFPQANFLHEGKTLKMTSTQLVETSVTTKSFSASIILCIIHCSLYLFSHWLRAYSLFWESAQPTDYSVNGSLREQCMISKSNVKFRCGKRHLIHKVKTCLN